MASEQQQVFEMMDLDSLTNILLTADQRPDVQRAAMSAMSRRSPLQRNARLAVIIGQVVSHPERYNQDVMMSLIDILATDPEPDATATMIEVLPKVLDAAMKPGGALKPQFRRYFYQALVSRRRESDIPVWQEMLPQLKPDTIAAALLDPVAKPLEALEPFTLIGRLSQRKRNKLLWRVMFGALERGNLGLAARALRTMLSSNRTKA
jgi:hypothetical protein